MSARENVLSHFNWLVQDRVEETLEAASDESSLLERLSKVRVLDKTDAEVELASSAVRKVRSGQALTGPENDALEAIVLPAERPVIDIVHDSFGAVEPPFAHFSENEAIRRRIEAAIPAVGRIGLPGRPSIPFGGTGFVVGEGILMTNRHVAVLFAQGLGREGLSFQSGQSANVDFKQEVGNGAATEQPFEIERVLMIHPYWDVALLKVRGLATPPLGFLAQDPGELANREIAVIGYPAFDTRNDAALQLRIFRRLFNVKRLQPGLLRERREVSSFENLVSAATHDASTLGGNSGSAVIDVSTGKVVALHFAGRYLEANFAVPMQELAKDRRVRDAGLAFEGAAASSTSWDASWLRADPERAEPRRSAAPSRSRASSAEGRPSRSTASTPSSQGELDLRQPVSWTIPLSITVRLGMQPEVQVPARKMAAAQDDLVEKLVEPFHDDDYEGRTGYDEQFLGSRVRLPRVLDESVVSKVEGRAEIPYEHFSLVVHKKRRIALYTASNVDGRAQAKKPEPGKKYTRQALSRLQDGDIEKWFVDPRVPALHQLPDKFFTKDRAAFDKGHLVRREDVAWGKTYEELRRANGDTYHVTNCSPQVMGFNRSNLGGLWGELENVVLDQAEASEDKFSVFSGPILDRDDPLFAGFDDEGRITVRIPRRFWKVVVTNGEAGLQTFAFLLDQDLSGTDFGIESFEVDADWRARMISIADLERQIGLLEFPRELHTSDQFVEQAGESVRRDGGLESFVG